MMYAVELFFDEKTESTIKNIWEGLKFNNITSNMADIDEIRPHITLGVYNSEVPIEHFTEVFKDFSNTITSMKVNFESISFFPISNEFPTTVVFSPPRVTNQLFETSKFL